MNENDDYWSVKRLEREVHDLSRIITDLTQQNSSAKAENEELRCYLRQWHDVYGDIQSKAVSLEKEKSELQNIKASEDAKINKSKREIESLQAACKSAKEENEELLLEVQNLKEELLRTVRQLKSVKEKATGLEREKLSASEDRELFREKARHCSELEERIAEYRRVACESQALYDRARRDLELEAVEKRSREEGIRELEIRVADLANANEKLTKELECASLKLREAVSRCDEYNSVLKQQTKNLEVMKYRGITWEKALSDKIEILTKENSRLRYMTLNQC